MKSQFVVCPSVVRPSVASIISEPIAWDSFKLPIWRFFDFYFLKYIFWLLTIFFILANMGPMGAKFQNTTPYSNHFWISSNFRVFFSMVLTKVLFWIFINFNTIFQFSLTQDPMGMKISKRYSSFKLLLNYSKLLLKFLLSGPHKRTLLDFWNFEFPICKIFFFFFFLKFTNVPYGETKNLNYLETSERRAKWSGIWASGMRIQCIQGTFDS